MRPNSNGADDRETQPLGHSESPDTALNAGKPQKQNWLQQWTKLSLRTKATALAIALGTLPVIGVGSLAYYSADQTISEKVFAARLASATTFSDKINRFIYERYGDIQVLSRLPILTNPKGTAGVSLIQKRQILTQFAETYGVYDSIAAYDLQGNLLVRSEQPSEPSVLQMPEFQRVVQTGEVIISEPQLSAITKKSVMYFMAPIKDSLSGRTTGIIMSRMPVQNIESIVAEFKTQETSYAIVNAKGQYFLDSTETLNGKEAQAVFPFLAPLRQEGKTGTEILKSPASGRDEIFTYVPFAKVEGLPQLKWGTLLSVNENSAFEAQNRLLLTLTLGTVLTAGAVTAIAAFLARRATQPIQEAAQAVQKLGQGDLQTRLQVKGADELAVLGSNINAMASQIEMLVTEQKAETDRIEKARQEARQEADARATEQQQQREFLQKRALELLMEVDPVSRGDLTIRANVTPDEIGTIADSYNAIIRSLRQIVQQVQTASQSVTLTAQGNEASVKQVVDETSRQTTVILAALNQVEQMAQSSQGVADRAKQAEAQVERANQVVQAGDEAMNRTVIGISAIRETVSETAKKVKRLGEASQKISKVVNLIGDFAAQTNLLALNAAIEAARAGEEGRGFSVVAEEVRALAQQSATATADIEQLVEEIQLQTNEVVTAMEAGTEQVVMGTQLVEESRQKLTQIATVGNQINELIQEIAQSASAQTEASSSVSQTMKSVATIADQTSKQSEAVANSFSQLLEVAQGLQVSVAQFKVS
jgi:methyl-accepting chemotaxis protein PixJ